MWYGSSVLLKWWTEPGHLREVIAPGLAGRNAKGRLVGVIERHSDTGDFPHELLRASLGAFLMDGPAPYNLRRGQGPGLTLEPPDATGGDYDSSTGRITVNSPEIESFGALFRRIRASAGDRPSTPKPLFIAVHPADRDDVRAALVEGSTRLPDRRRVTPLDIRTDGGDSFVVPRFADDTDETSWVDLVAVNGAEQGRQTLSWSYRVGAPPVLERVDIEIEGGTPVYAAEWEQPELPDEVVRGDTYMNRRRTLNEEFNALPAEPPDRDRLDDVVVRLRFSRPVVVPDVTLGTTTLMASGPLVAVQSDWVLRASRVGIASAERPVGLGLSVSAFDSDDAFLDGRPATPTFLRRDGTEWIGYEAAEGNAVGTGGDDRTHWIKLTVGSFDCSAIGMEFNAARKKEEELGRITLFDDSALQDPAYLEAGRQTERLNAAMKDCVDRAFRLKQVPAK